MLTSSLHFVELLAVGDNGNSENRSSFPFCFCVYPRDRNSCEHKRVENS